MYQDDAILPENLDAIKKIKDSGVFERMANRLTEAVALPHDLQVVVTDKTPKGINDPSTEVDGRKIWWPPRSLSAALRALLCRKEWTHLNYGRSTALEPQLTESCRKETKAVREQARKDLEDENKVLRAKIRQIRSRQ